MEEDGFDAICEMCGGDKFELENDGHYYCTICRFQNQDLMETGVDNEDFVKDPYGPCSGFYFTSHARKLHASTHVVKPEPVSQFMLDSDVRQNGVKMELEEGMGESEVADDEDFVTDAYCAGAGFYLSSYRRRLPAQHYVVKTEHVSRFMSDSDVPGSDVKMELEEGMGENQPQL